MEILEPKFTHDIYDGVIEGKDVKSYKKYLKQVPGLFKDDSNVDPETLLYTVYSYEEGDATQLGNLNWGLTILEPVTINDECVITKGHFHENVDCAEIYFGCAGEGLLLLMDETGKCWAEKVFKGSVHYINGKLAHRLICTGETQCKVGACWPSAAGHNYEAIEKHNFPIRVFKKDGKVEIIDQ